MKLSSINLNPINKAVSGITKTISSAKIVVDDINDKVSESNVRIREKISSSVKLFQARRSAIRRKERESLIEASGIRGATKRIGKNISDSSKGFLGRILDFVAEIIVGWAVINLPKIIKGAQDLIKRIQKFINLVQKYTSGLIEFFQKFQAELGEVISGLAKFDLEPINKNIRNLITRLQNNFRRVETGFIDEVNNFVKFDPTKFANQMNEERRKELQLKLLDQIDEESYNELPENIQDALLLMMTLQPDLKLKEVDIEDINSGNIKNIETIIRESGIIKVKNENDEIVYRLREDVENYKGMFTEIDELLNNNNKKNEKFINEVEKNNKEINGFIENLKDDRTEITKPPNKKKTTVIINDNFNDVVNKATETGSEFITFDESGNFSLSDKVFTDLMIQKIGE